MKEEAKKISCQSPSPCSPAMGDLGHQTSTEMLNFSNLSVLSAPLHYT